VRDNLARHAVCQPQAVLVKYASEFGG
jgi:hypothetical protein